MDHIVGHEIHLNKFFQISLEKKDLQSILTDHKEIKLEPSNRKITVKSPNKRVTSK